VLWRGATLISKTKEVISQLKSMGKKLVFVTNNSTKSRENYLEKFKSYDIEVNKEDIISSSYAVARYLKYELKFTKKVYVIGEAGIEHELDEAGIRWVGGQTHQGSATMAELEHLTLDPEVGAVVVGFDIGFNYKKLAYAKLYLQNKDCILLATNRDQTFPSSGHILPGGGTMVTAVEFCSGRQATTVGKPSLTLMHLLIHEYGLDAGRTCMVGDRLSTDILFGLEGGTSTLLVLTGVTSLDELMSKENTIIPHYYTDSVADLLLPTSAADEKKE
jgi:phosphoglycolate/pyridoxal phosphate phosphatase family enzyme